MFAESEKKPAMTHERRLMMNAAKIRDTWVHALTTSLMTVADPASDGACLNSGPARLLVVINPGSGEFIFH